MFDTKGGDFNGSEEKGRWEALLTPRAQPLNLGLGQLEMDWETRGVVDLLNQGAYVYASHPDTEALMASYKINHGPVNRWRRGQPCPDDIREHVERGGMIAAHNASFERLIWWLIMTPRHGWPRPTINQFRCTAATAAAMSLPRSLDRLGAALDLDVKKDRKGKAYIKKHSVPQGFTPEGRPIWNEDPASLEGFHDYCDTDVKTEAEADSRLVPFSEEEQSVYILNEIINDRGIQLDIESAKAAVLLAEKAKTMLDREMCQVTAGYVAKCTEVTKLVEWVHSQGVDLGTVQKADVEELLDECDDLPDNVRHALELRQEAAKTSVSKIAKMLDRVCDDGRIRGVYLHQGAGQTGRFSSRGVQCHNMPKYRKPFEDAVEEGQIDFEHLFYAIRSTRPEWLTFMYGPVLGRPLHLLSDAIRSFLIARPGFDLIDADYASIEGRMAAWFTGEDWKVEAYRALDRGEGFGMYELTAAGIYGIKPEEVKKAIHRPVGKVAELSMGYQGGCGALSRMARDNKLKLHTVFPLLWETADEMTRDGIKERLQERIAKHDPTIQKIGSEGWMAGELIKIGWRAKHPATCHGWKALEEAATAAVADPGSIYTADIPIKVQYLVRHGFLWCLLPPGRCLAYGAPKFQETEAPWADKTLPPKEREKKLSVTVMGVDSQTEKWVRYPIYGGSLFNNVVQGSARDILVNGIKKAEAAGYPIVLHTHDEMCAEVPEGWGDVKAFERLICELPAWADGLPLVSDGWRGKRYRK